MDKKILLTGASGFVGTNILLKLLNENNEIFALANKNRISVRNDKIKPLYSSLENIEGIKDEIPKRLNYVIHCAGLTKAVDIDEYYFVNTYGTKKLLRFFVKNDIQVEHFVYISSLAAVGPQRKLEMVDENYPPSPIKGYGESKLLAEKEIKKYSESLNWTIVRPPFIFGPYDYDTLNLFRIVKYGVKFYIGNRYFSFVYSEDLAEKIVTILGNQASFRKVYFFAYDKYSTHREFLNTISTFVNPKAKFIQLHPTFLIWMATLLSPFLSKNTPINRVKFTEIKQKYWLCSSEKIKKELNLFPVTSLPTAVEKTYLWYKSNGLI